MTPWAIRRWMAQAGFPWWALWTLPLGYLFAALGITLYIRPWGLSWHRPRWTMRDRRGGW